MRMGIKTRGSKRVMRALERAGGNELSKALRSGYAKAARIIRDEAKLSSEFKDDTGRLRKSWKISSRLKPYPHAKVTNTVFYSIFLERSPLFLGFFEKAAEATKRDQLKAVRTALARHMRKLRSASK